MKIRVHHTVWCNISGEAAEAIWHWWLLGVKGFQACTACCHCYCDLQQCGCIRVSSKLSHGVKASILIYHFLAWIYPTMLTIDCFFIYCKNKIRKQNNLISKSNFFLSQIAPPPPLSLSRPKNLPPDCTLVARQHIHICVEFHKPYGETTSFYWLWVLQESTWPRVAPLKVQTRS